MAIITAEQALEASKDAEYTRLLALFDKALNGFDKALDGLDKLKERQEENREQMRKTDEQIRRTDEQMQRTDEQMRRTDEQMRRTDERIDRMAIEIGGLGNSVGLFMETLFSANLWDKFTDEGYDFEQGGKRVFRYKGKIIAEVDFFLENGEYVMAVEVKTSLTEHYVNEHLKKLERIREYFDNIKENRILLGAVAGPSVSGDVVRYAQKNGLYVIVQSGAAAKIADKIDGFRAREW
jgi:hypothetical protein